MEDRFTDIEQMPIDQIVVGQRRRQKLGNLQSLANSIATRGLLHPIIIRDNVLVSGQRRLEACKRLGWTTISARRAERMTDEELRAVELEENTERLALADYESSKMRLAQIRQAEADLKAKAAEEYSAGSAKYSKRGRKGEGRPKKTNSRKAVAEVTGIPETSQRETEKHVALADQYPFMKRNGWVQYQVLQAGDELKELPEEDRNKIAAMLDQDAILPETSIEIIKNVVQMPAAERKAIYKLAESDDPFERTTALTQAAKVPPPPDPALNRLREALTAMNRAVKICRTEEFIKPITEARDGVHQIEEDFTFYTQRKNGSTN